MNVIKAIPVEHIRPFPGQPRRYFDTQALQELADSIKTHGQSTPAWVVPLRDDQDDQSSVDAELGPLPLARTKPRQYELIAGERRWRACQLVGVPTLICEVREGLSLEQQYIHSVMENFGRKDCTTMETARSVGQLLKQYDGDCGKTAKVFARSEAWVRQLAMLLRLEPEVAAMLEPPNARLTTQVGVSLSNLQPEVQVRLAREIAARGLKHKASLSFLRASVTDGHRVHKQGRRRPSDDFALLKRFLESLGPQAQAIMVLGEERLQSMFTHRDPQVKVTVRAIIQKRVAQLQQLEGLLK